MHINFKNNSLIIGLAAGFTAAMLVSAIAWLFLENKDLKNSNTDLQKQLEMKKISDIPLTIIKKHAYSDIVYEEFPKEDDLEDVEDIPLYEKNKKSVKLDPNKVKIAIIIDDVGVHVENSLYSASKLPKEVTFSYLPYGSATQSIIKQEFAKNREAMLHLPAEPQSSIDPGPNALKLNMDQEKIEHLTYHNLNQVLDYIVGVNNHMGSKFTADQAKMEEVLSIVNSNKLFFLDSVTTSKTKVKAAAEHIDSNMPILKRDIFLDHKRTKQFISSQLSKVEKVAKRNGYAIAIGHPHKITTDILSEWAKTLKEKNIQLVPISTIVNMSEKNNKELQEPISTTSLKQ